MRGSFIGAGGAAPNAADSLTASMSFDTGVGGVLNATALSDTATAGLLAPAANGAFTLSSIGVLGGGGAFSLEADLRFTLAPSDRISLPGSVEMVDDTPLTETPEPASATLFGAGLAAVGLLRRRRT